MKNIKRIIIYGVLAVLTLSFIYIVYPRSGTLENMVLENYKTTEFTYGKLNIEDEVYTLAEDSNEKIEGFLNEIKEIKIKEVSKIKEEDINEVYNLRLYSYGNSEDLGLVIFDFKYIKIFGSVKGRHSNAKYEILNEEDRNLLKEVIEEIKEDNELSKERLLKDLKEINKDITFERAKELGFFIEVHGTLESDFKIFQEFIERVSNNEDAEITIMTYTIEGEAIVNKLIYKNGKYEGIIDFTRDSWMTLDYDEYSYDYLIKTENEESIYYILTNDKDFKEEDIISEDGEDIVILFSLNKT